MISIAEIGSTMPIATSLAWQRELGEPTRWSPLSIRNEPIAMAGPVAAMITGTGKLSSRIDSSNPPDSMPSAGGGVTGVEDAEVEAGAEHPRVARQHDGLDLAVGGGLLGAVERLR